MTSKLYTLLVRAAARATQPFRFRGYWHIIRGLQFLLFVRTETTAKIEMLSDSKFALSLDDPYWSRVLSPAFTYEKEIYDFLEAHRSVPYSFIDCGANLGYWSILASANFFGNHASVAIEASLDTFEHLKRNQMLNHNRFQVLHRAVSDRSGEMLQISAQKDHASRSITTENQRTTAAASIALDDLIAQHKFLQTTPRLIKLDVEGAEIRALKGAAKALAQESTAVIYEEHGNDVYCEVTRWVFQQLPLHKVFFLRPNNEPKLIHTIDELQLLKCKRTTGYNMLLTQKKSLYWP